MQIYKVEHIMIIILIIFFVQENVTPDRFSLLCSICQKHEGACLTVCSDVYDNLVYCVNIVTRKHNLKR